MRILFKNALILSLENESLFNGDLIVEDENIVYIGKNGLAKGTFDKIIEVDGNLLMPSFKNGHAHTAMVFARSLGNNLPLEDWLFKLIIPMEQNFQKNDIFYLTQAGLLEYISSGITHYHEMYVNRREILKANEKIGLKINYLFCPGTETKKIPSDLEKFPKMFKNASFSLGVHSLYTLGKGDLEFMKALIDKYQLPFYLHLGETKTEVENFRKLHPDETEVEFLVNRGFFKYGGAIFHGVYLSKHDLELLKEHNVSVIANLSSNVKLRSGIPLVNKYHSKGVNVGLGTDGASSNNSLNMFKELFLASTLPQLKDNSFIVSPFEYLKMANVNVMKAVGNKDSLYLKEGMKADIIMIDMNHPSMHAKNDIIANLVYAGSSSLIKMTMCNGKILYYNGKFKIKGLNIKKLYDKVEEITERLKGSVK